MFHRSTSSHLSLIRLLITVTVVSWLLSYSSLALAFGLTECAGQRNGADLGCTAQDVSITGISVGHDLIKNFWLSVGYNFTGFTDRDFSSAEFTAQGPFIKLRMKFDQESVKEMVRLFSDQ